MSEPILRRSAGIAVLLGVALVAVAQPARRELGGAASGIAVTALAAVLIFG